MILKKSFIKVLIEVKHHSFTTPILNKFIKHVILI